MLKCEELMQEEFLNLTKDKIFQMNDTISLGPYVSFCFVKHLNRTLKKPDVVLKHIRYEYVILYTVYAKQDGQKEKLVDFAISVDIQDDTFTVTDCYVTAWLNKVEE